MSEVLQKEIRNRLEKAFPVSALEIIDESHLHKGHEGAKGGASHFAIQVVSSHFTHLNAIQRHRMIYTPLKDLIPHVIHALKISALTPEEFNK